MLLLAIKYKIIFIDLIIIIVQTLTRIWMVLGLKETRRADQINKMNYTLFSKALIIISSEPHNNVIMLV